MKPKSIHLTNLGLAALGVAAMLASVPPAHAQSGFWQTIYDAQGKGDFRSAMLDPFPDHDQPSLFEGNRPLNADDGCSVKWIGPLGDPTTVARDACSDVDFATTPGQLGFDPYAPPELPAGRLYSVGTDNSGWVVRVSDDEGASWRPDFDAPPQEYSGGWATGFSADGLGNAFVCGFASNRCIVRQRDVNGHWTTIRDLGARRKSYSPRGMNIAFGYLFVVGDIYEDKWVVERLDLSELYNGTSPLPWETVALPAPLALRKPYKQPWHGALAVTSSGADVYVLGWAGNMRQNPQMTIVLKGENYGTGPWTVVARFGDSSDGNEPADFAFDSKGNIYVVGTKRYYEPDGTLRREWIVRKGAPDGGGFSWELWRPIDLDPATNSSNARRVLVNPTTDDVYVTGDSWDVDANGNTIGMPYAIVQKWVDLVPTP